MTDTKEAKNKQKVINDLWVETEEEIHKQLDEYIFFKNGGSENPDLQFESNKSCINIEPVKIHQKMLIYVHLNKLPFPKHIELTVELKHKILDTMFEEYKKLIREKWEADYKRDSLEKVIDTIQLTFDSTHFAFFPVYFMRMCHLSTSYFKMVEDRIKQYRQSKDLFYDGYICLFRNWLLKIYSNSDIISRVFCSIGMMKINNLYNENSCDILEDLFALRGITNVLYGIYLRIYFIDICRELYPDNIKAIASNCFNDIEIMLSDSDWLHLLLKTDQSLDKNTCFTILGPALKYITHYIMSGSSKTTMKNLLKRFSKIQVPILLESVINSIDPGVLYENIDDVLQSIYDFHNRKHSTASLVSVVGKRLILLDEPLHINSVERIWTIVQQYNNFKEYISCAIIWIEYALKFNQNAYAKGLLSNIFTLINNDICLYNFNSHQITEFIKIVIKNTSFEELIQNDDLFTSMNNIKQPNLIIQCCVEIFEKIIKIGKIHDQIHISKIQKLFSLCNEHFEISLADASLSILNKYISTILSQISYGDDLKSIIKVLSEFRATLYGFPDIFYILYQVLLDFFVKNATSIKTNVESDDIVLALTFPLNSLPYVLPNFNAIRFCLAFSQLSLQHEQINIGFLFLDLVFWSFPNIKLSSLREKEELSSIYLIILETLSIYPKHPIEHKFTYFLKFITHLKSSSLFEDNQLWKVQIYSKILYYIAINIQVNQMIHTDTSEHIDDVDNQLDESDYLTIEKIIRFINQLFFNSHVDEKIKKKIIKIIYDISNTEIASCQNFLNSLQNIKI